MVSTPTGLNSAYSLYFDFTATGDPTIGSIDTFTMDLYGAAGVSAFGIDGNNDAFVTNANPAILLGTNSFLYGSVAGGAPGSDLSAQSESIFSATAAGALAFLSPQTPAQFHGAFFHSAQQAGGITPVDQGAGIVLVGGDDTLEFVPEPASMALFSGGLFGIVLLRRKRS